jgi:endoribonuclease LACTB2
MATELNLVHHVAGLKRVITSNGHIMDDPTNCFIIGADPVWLVDPGSMPGIDAVHEALRQLGNPDVGAIILTHIHVDHGGSAGSLSEYYDAPVWFHPAEYPELAVQDFILRNDRELSDGEILELGPFQFEVILTPGHALGHISLVETDQNFGLVGDLVTGWGSSAIFPPYGSLKQYITSMERIRDRGVNPLYPAHGDPVENGPQALEKFITRRRQREEQILAYIHDHGPSSVNSVLYAVYENIPQDLIADVTGNVQLHLDKLVDEGLIAPEDDHYVSAKNNERDSQ